MESVRVRIPAQATTTQVVGHLAFGDMIHRVTFSFDGNVTSTGATVTLTLYQYRSGVQIGSELAMVTLSASATIYAFNPQEFNPPPTPDAVQYFEDLDTLILVVSWSGTSVAFSGILSWM